MPGSADIGDNLVDSLIEVVDDLRSELHPAFGVRQFRVYVVRRTFTSGYAGDESEGFTDEEVELTPQPLVEPYRTRNDLQPCGLDEAGLVKLREISLTYTEAELTGNFGTDADLGNDQLLYYKISDAHGQGIEDSYWMVASRPFPDRENDLGWNIELKKTPNL